MINTCQKTAQGILFVILLAITIFADLPGDSLLIGEAQNTAHTFAFGILALLALGFIRNTRHLATTPVLSQYIVAGVICLLAGAGVEIIQAFIQRDADIWDVVRDCAGIVAFLGGYSLVDRHISNHGTRPMMPRIVIASVSLLTMLAALLPAARITYVYIERNHVFPRLLDFDNNWNSNLISLHDASLTIISTPPEWQQDPDTLAARVTLQPALYPGIEFLDPYPDWSEFTTFSMKIYSTEPEPPPLTLRINDQQHNSAFNDRFNHQFDIRTGENVIRIPVSTIKTAPSGRQMDMKHIKTMILFAPGLKHSTTFYIIDMRLE